jgi:hypothetical protein
MTSILRPNICRAIESLKKKKIITVKKKSDGKSIYSFQKNYEKWIIKNDNGCKKKSVINNDNGMCVDVVTAGDLKEKTMKGKQKQIPIINNDNGNHEEVGVTDIYSKKKETEKRETKTIIKNDNATPQNNDIVNDTLGITKNTKIHDTVIKNDNEPLSKMITGVIKNDNVSPNTLYISKTNKNKERKTMSAKADVLNPEIENLIQEFIENYPGRRETVDTEKKNPPCARRLKNS